MSPPDGGAGQESGAASPPVFPVLRRAAVVAAVVAAGCWRLGEPTGSPLLVTWVAYPETVLAGEIFSFEYAGPVSPDACARPDTSWVRVGDGSVTLGGERSRFETLCADERVSFYEARPLSMPAAGRYRVRSGDRSFGEMVVLDSGTFSGMSAVGEGTVREAGGCLMFGPGWASNQRPFVLSGAGPGIHAVAGTDSVIWVRGRLLGFTLCGQFGSRPRIVVDSARVTEGTGADWYPTDRS